jgi:ABC-type uncharacterized transport system auxiliary subunit
MKRRVTGYLLALACLTTLFGCMGKVRYPTYYTLHVTPKEDPPVGREAHASIAIREFRAPGYLRQGAIVYRTSPEQLGFYDYHRWAVDPREFVTNAIADRLRATGRFAEVKTYDGRPDVDYVLSGSLDSLEEMDYEDGVKVEVALSARMTEIRTGTTVWVNSASDTAKVARRDVPSVVAEMSRAMDRAIEKLVSSIPDSTKSGGN